MVRAYTTGPVRVRIGPSPQTPAAPPPPVAPTPEARVAAILVALDSGQLEQAAQLSEQALAVGVRHPAPFCVMAMAHEFNGRFAEAIPCLKQALTLFPADISMMMAL